MKNSNQCIQQICYITNIKGLHARASSQIVQLSKEFKCELTFTHKDKSASGLSLIKLLTLDAPKGSKIEVNAEGADSKRALLAVQELFTNGFGEL